MTLFHEPTIVIIWLTSSCQAQNSFSKTRPYYGINGAELLLSCDSHLGSSENKIIKFKCHRSIYFYSTSHFQMHGTNLVTTMYTSVVTLADTHLGLSSILENCRYGLCTAKWSLLFWIIYVCIYHSWTPPVTIPTLSPAAEIWHHQVLEHGRAASTAGSGRCHPRFHGSSSIFSSLGYQHAKPSLHPGTRPGCHLQ